MRRKWICCSERREVARGQRFFNSYSGFLSAPALRSGWFEMTSFLDGAQKAFSASFDLRLASLAGRTRRPSLHDYFGEMVGAVMLENS